MDFYGVSGTIAVCLLPDGHSYLWTGGNDVWSAGESAFAVRSLNTGLESEKSDRCWPKTYNGPADYPPSPCRNNRQAWLSRPVCSATYGHYATGAPTRSLNNGKPLDEVLNKGFDFLGYHLTPEGLTVATTTIARFVTRAPCYPACFTSESRGRLPTAPGLGGPWGTHSESADSPTYVIRLP